MCESPVSIVGNKHPLSDLPFNLLVNNQQHDSIKVESLTLGGKETHTQSTSAVSFQEVLMYNEWKSIRKSVNRTEQILRRCNFSLFV